MRPLIRADPMVGAGPEREAQKIPTRQAGMFCESMDFLRFQGFFCVGWAFLRFEGFLCGLGTFSFVGNDFCYSL